MDIWEILQNRVLMQSILWGVFLLIGVVYVLVRIIVMILRPSKIKSFADEAQENQNKPLFSGSESIGSVSARLGEDVRDVWGMGYSNDQSSGVLTGKYTLEETYKMGPDGNSTPGTRGWHVNRINYVVKSLPLSSPSREARDGFVPIAGAKPERL